VLEELRIGRHVAVHCRAGMGRTGMFAACLAREVLGLSGNEALVWIRRLVPGAVETRGQEDLVRAYLG
jgi:protein-tyrosine phosphatase